VKVKSFTQNPKDFSKYGPLLDANGTISGVHDFGAGEMLEIEPVKSTEKQASFFHPFTKIAVPKIDLAAGRVVIHIEDAVMGRSPATPESGPSDKAEE